MSEKTFEITLTVRFEADVPDDYFDDAVWEEFINRPDADVRMDVLDAIDYQIEEVDG